jgi:hypothetical protein
MLTKPTFEELEHRIRRDIDHFEGNLPETYAIAWYGYLAAMIEWGLLSPSDHGKLTSMLPMLLENPATSILLGRE